MSFCRQSQFGNNLAFAINPKPDLAENRVQTLDAIWWNSVPHAFEHTFQHNPVIMTTAKKVATTSTAG